MRRGRFGDYRGAFGGSSPGAFGTDELEGCIPLHVYVTMVLFMDRTIPRLQCWGELRRPLFQMVTTRLSRVDTHE